MPKLKTSGVVVSGWGGQFHWSSGVSLESMYSKNDPHDGKRNYEALWPIFKINQQRSRYLYRMTSTTTGRSLGRCTSSALIQVMLALTSCRLFYPSHPSSQLALPSDVEFSLERLCCVHCIETRHHNFATTCVCSPKHLREEQVIECAHCGCLAAPVVTK
ncbi:hypothetical protein CFC21_070814 [Triticum aestivum]|uniref:Uncharacterized protein n=2 Tax=Triticum aestivum TaxID=4565 RepID=A0A9R1HGS9_WHEAT|nr:hypothetical protein CFC21_070814 [Triticum aestivum]